MYIYNSYCVVVVLYVQSSVGGLALSVVCTAA